MNFIRPEARTAILRWREVVAGSLAMCVGGWWAIGTHGILPWVGYAILALSAALIWAGLQRARFRGTTGGQGVVTVDEGQVTYYGPLNGGAVSMREISTLELDPSQHPAHWRLIQPGQPALEIPVNAEGADELFDAFAALPDLKTEKMLQELRQQPDHPVVIWKKDAARLH